MNKLRRELARASDHDVSPAATEAIERVVEIATAVPRSSSREVRQAAINLQQYHQAEKRVDPAELMRLVIRLHQALLESERDLQLG
jgi:hypothetical protein